MKLLPIRNMFSWLRRCLDKSLVSGYFFLELTVTPPKAPAASM